MSRDDEYDDTDERGEDYEANRKTPLPPIGDLDPWAPRDPFDTTPPVERDLKAWIAAYYRSKNPALGRNDS